jgi:hypothetical protein
MNVIFHGCGKHLDQLTFGSAAVFSIFLRTAILGYPRDDSHAGYRHVTQFDHAQ